MSDDMKPEPVIELRNLCLDYEDGPVVKGINLKIYENEFITFLGPSGCGKTTTLRMIAGLTKPTSGEVLIDGKVFNNIPAYARPLNTVFQRYALFPNMNVLENVMVGLKNRPFSYLYDFFGGKEKVLEELKATGKKPNLFNIDKFLNEKIKIEALNALKLVKLQGFENRSIDQMSGGQQQRCAIARAIVNRPRILLLDEPLAALDLKLRENMQYELKEMQKKLGITFIFVTHDQTEAMTMSTRIVVMADGVIQQLGAPKEIYDYPANKFVANFVGESNIINCKYFDEDGKTYIKIHDWTYECPKYPFENGEEVLAVIRPEDFQITKPNENHINCTVQTCIFRGVFFETCAMVNGKEMVIHEYKEVKPGDAISLFVEPDCIHLIKKED